MAGYYVFSQSPGASVPPHPPFKLIMERRRRRRFVSLAEVRSQLDAMELKCERTPALYGYESADIVGNFKHFIVTCNSLAIVFLQFDLVQEALDVLRRATAADVKLYRIGTLLDRLWQGRITTYNNLAYLFQKYDFLRTGEYSASLKFVYDAQSLLLTIEKAGGHATLDIIFCTNFLTFHVLWKLRKAKEAEQYILLCAKTIRTMLAVKMQSRLAREDLLNALGIVHMALAATQVSVRRDLSAGQSTLQAGLQALDAFDLPVKPLMYRFAEELQSHCESQAPSKASNVDSSDGVHSIGTPKSSIPEIPSTYFRKEFGLASKAWSWLISEEYEMVFYCSTFMPYISTPHAGANTPVIRSSELEQARRLALARRLGDTTTESTRLNTSVPGSRDTLRRSKVALSSQSRARTPQDSSRLVGRKTSLSPHFSKEIVRTERVRPATQRAEKRRIMGTEEEFLLNWRPRPQLQHEPQSLRRVIETSREHEDDRLNLTSVVAHPRVKSHISEQRLTAESGRKIYLSPEVAPGRLRRRRRKWSKNAGNRTVHTDDLIMVEFAPVGDYSTTGVQLHPMSARQPQVPLSQFPEGRTSKSSHARTRNRPAKADQCVLLDISIGDTAEEPKEGDR